MEGKWWIFERFWMDRTWAADVNSLYWSHDAKHLYIGTTQVYGDGGLFKIDLLDKSFTRIWPVAEKKKGETSMTEILSVDETNGMIKVRVHTNDFSKEEVLEIPMN